MLRRLENERGTLLTPTSQRIKAWADHLKADTYALCLAYTDSRVPWYAKLLVAVIVAYVLSPIDLIPDFIPVIGYLDDLLLVPAGIALAARLIPKGVLEEHRANARLRLAPFSAVLEDRLRSFRPRDVGAEEFQDSSLREGERIDLQPLLCVGDAEALECCEQCACSRCGLAAFW